MPPTDRSGGFWTPTTLAVAVALLLAARFSASTILAGFNLTTATLAHAGQILEAYEVLLPLPLLAVFFLLLWQLRSSVPRPLLVAVVILDAAAFLTWALALLSVGDPMTTDVFSALAVVAVASVSVLADFLRRGSKGHVRDWSGWAHLAILIAVPFVLAMRIAALEGLGTTPAAGGSLAASWLFANLPTLLLELLMIILWAEVVLGRRAVELRARWYAFLPFVLVPLVILASEERPLSGYILSTLIDWGANLALFAPAPYSLGLAATALACYASTLLLLGRRGRKDAWNLLCLGSASILLAGFYPSMASVAGLGVALMLTTLAVMAWTERPVVPDLRET